MSYEAPFELDCKPLSVCKERIFSGCDPVFDGLLLQYHIIDADTVKHQACHRAGVDSLPESSKAAHNADSGNSHTHTHKWDKALPKR